MVIWSTRTLIRPIMVNFGSSKLPLRAENRANFLWSSPKSGLIFGQPIWTLNPVLIEAYSNLKLSKNFQDDRRNGFRVTRRIEILRQEIIISIRFMIFSQFYLEHWWFNVKKVACRVAVSSMTNGCPMITIKIGSSEYDDNESILQIILWNCNDGRICYQKSLGRAKTSRKRSAFWEKNLPNNRKVLICGCSKVLWYGEETVR